MQSVAQPIEVYFLQEDVQYKVNHAQVVSLLHITIVESAKFLGITKKVISFTATTPSCASSLHELIPVW